MSKNPIIIGQGSYGCAFRPAIPCEKGSNRGIDTKISKVLTKSAADAEYDEYTKIAKADPKKKYFLGKPQKCLMSQTNYDAHVKNSGCRILKPNTTSKDYKMLQYADGGSDLDDFVTIHYKNFVKKSASSQIDRFWLNAHQLFMGLKTFSEKNILHDDLKPQNIVFKFDLAKDTMEFNFIDFGLVKDLSTLISDIQNGVKNRNFHWSRPIDNGFCNLVYKQIFATRSRNTIIDFYSKLISDSIVQRQPTGLNISTSAYRLFFEYAENSLNKNTDVMINDNIRYCMEGIMHYQTDFEGFVKKSLETCDTFSLGFTLNHVANKMHQDGKLNDADYARLHNFFKKLFDFHVYMRWSNIDAILNEYESVLRLNGVLGRLGKKFRNHSVVSEKRKQPVRAFPHLSAAQARAIGAVSPQADPLAPCPPGKERNPATRRCINTCPPGKTRKNGRCVKGKPDECDQIAIAVFGRVPSP
jgi:serine/threonine protein kinase